MGKDPKVKYSKRDNLPFWAGPIKALCGGADTNMDVATIESGGKKYEGTGRSRQEALEKAIKKMEKERR